MEEFVFSLYHWGPTAGAMLARKAKVTQLPYPGCNCLSNLAAAWFLGFRGPRLGQLICPVESPSPKNPIAH